MKRCGYVREQFYKEHFWLSHNARFISSFRTTPSLRITCKLSLYMRKQILNPIAWTSAERPEEGSSQMLPL